MKNQCAAYLAWGLLLATALLLPVWSSSAQELNRVGLVVQFGDGSVLTRCIEFGEASISGYEALRRSDLSVVAEFSAMGAAVCKIQNEGCDFPGDSCFCHCQSSPCVYWAYHYQSGGVWQYAGFGASARELHNGDVDGWAWGEGSPQGGAQPPLIPLEQICAPPATATPLPPSATPIPPTVEPVVWFRLEQNPIPAGACTMLRWDSNGLLECYLDGESVGLNGERQVCPGEPQVFTLRVITLGGQEQSYTLNLGVTDSASPTATQSPVQNATRPATATAAPTSPAASPSARTSPKPGSTPAASPTAAPAPSPQPTKTPSAGPTATSAPPTTTATPLALARATGAASPTSNAPSGPHKDNSATNYLLFGGLLAFLLGLWLAVQIKNRSGR